jgi:hypothetical protein
LLPQLFRPIVNPTANQPEDRISIQSEVIIPPVTLLKNDELLGRDEARDALGLQRDGRYALFSLGPPRKR